ncbi:nucleotidyltransferase family protein [soil metagenome]|jgi:predicted nucleotidyltransferase|nr:nucleotidyltransferase family protein [Deinococcota bacterium]
MQRDKTLAILKVHMPELKAHFGVETLSLFGSTARNEAGEASDVDVLVVFCPDAGAGFFTLSRLKTHLEGLLGCRVDLLTPGAIRPKLRERIEKDVVHAA